MLEQQEISISRSFYLLKVKLHLKHLASAEMEALVHAIFTISRPKPDPTNPLLRLLSVSHTTGISNPITLSLLALFPVLHCS